MTTGLKNEIYFMRKNSEEIESVMANAYKLYEKLNEMDVPDDMKHMSLSIARDVHEIKKDYIRIIQGIEEEISEEYDEKRMSFQDILKILEDTTYHMLEAKMSISSWVPMLGQLYDRGALRTHGRVKKSCQQCH